MKNRTTVRELLPGVFCLTDRMNMNMTLLVGDRQALLVDTGYGFDDLPLAVRQVTDLPLTVINTHGHHDHASGNYLFDEVWIAAADVSVCEHYVPGSRLRIWGQAESRGVPLDDWTRDAYAEKGCGTLRVLRDSRFDLGGLTACLIEAPGHTPGSLAVYVPERRLMLTGDDWNPTTWLFFPEASGAQTLRHSVEMLLERDFDQVLPSHDARLWPRAALETFCKALAPDNLRQHAEAAPPMAPGRRVMVIHPQPDCSFFFDADKLTK